MPDTLDLTGAASMLFFSPGGLEELARRGEVPAAKIGKRWVFSRALLLDWLASAVVRYLRVTRLSAERRSFLVQHGAEGGERYYPRQEADGLYCDAERQFARTDDGDEYPKQVEMPYRAWKLKCRAQRDLSLRLDEYEAW